MKYNPLILKSAKEEWSDWLEQPDTVPSFTISDMRKWIESRPPLSAFVNLAQAIDLMQDEIDLLNIRLQEVTEELRDARRHLIKRV